MVKINQKGFIRVHLSVVNLHLLEFFLLCVHLTGVLLDRVLCAPIYVNKCIVIAKTIKNNWNTFGQISALSTIITTFMHIQNLFLLTISFSFRIASKSFGRPPTKARLAFNSPIQKLVTSIPFTLMPLFVCVKAIMFLCLL